MTSENSSGIPFDDRLPGASLLLDVEKMRPHVQSSFGLFGRVSQVQIRQVDYEPGKFLRVHYLAEIGTYRHDLCAQLGFAPPEKALVEKLKLAAKERKSARTPIIRLLTEGDAYLSWWPIDLGLGMLARNDVEVADLIGMDSAGPSVRLAWAPGRRAVMRFPQGVVKVYADPATAKSAANALKVLGAHVPTAPLLYRNVDEGLLGTELLVGKSLATDQAMASVEQAAAILTTIHDLDPAAVDPSGLLPVHDPEALLADLEPACRVASFCRPDLAPRIDQLVSTLRSTLPTGLPTVITHGHFNVTQLFSTKEKLCVLDFDKAAIGPRAIDVAGYAVNIASGRTTEHADAVALLEAFQAAYTHEVPGLSWYMAATMLRRIDTPLVRYSRDWSARIEVILGAAEQLRNG
jgi:aminoglycoside phosphotransferase (APT) family kinase protein